MLVVAGGFLGAWLLGEAPLAVPLVEPFSALAGDV